MKIRLYSAAVLLSLLAAFAGFAQDFSNKGKEFWLCFPTHVPGANQAQMALFITSDKNSSGTISVNGYNTTFSVTANQVSAPINIPYSAANINVGETGLVVNKGINVKVNPGQPPVVVYAHIYASARSAASLILPVTALGRKYYSVNFFQRSVGDSRSQFQVIAVEPNTTVRIQRRRNGILDPNITTVTLPAPGNLIQIQDNDDLTGSVIESVSTGTEGCKPIAVFSGSSAVAIGNNSGCVPNSYDPLYQQLYAVNTWGKNFGVINFSNSPNGYHMRVIAAEDGTTVNVGGTTVTLNAGQHYPQTSANPVPYVSPMTVTADKPITVAQYMMSQNCSGGGVGDPDMVILNPVEQNINDISIFSSSLQDISSKYLTVYMPTTAAASFRINNVPPSGNFVPMTPANGYSYLVENLSSLPNTSFRLTADEGFNAIAYGLGNVETYAYSAGTNVKDLYQFVSIQNQFGTVNFPATCKNSPFYFSMVFPYQPTRIEWDFGGLFPAVVNNAPVYDATWTVNGRQLYQYKIAAPYTISTPGTYPIKVTALNPTPDGCNGEQEITYDLQVYERPTADFNFSSNGCVSSPVQFTDNSTTNGRPSVSWSWDFGDATTGNVKNPSHLYSAGGSYLVKFSTITDVGCVSDTAQKTIVVTDPPVAKFAVSGPSCAGNAMTFTDQSTTASGTITKWTWNFGDGPDVVVNTNAPQTHTYATPGTYTVKLTVETAGGCKSIEFSTQVVVTSKPAAGFTFSSGCLPNASIQFTNQSTGGGSLSYLWKFGDGVESTDPNPVHIYTGSGPYTVTLTVTSSNGCTDVISKPLNTLYQQPQANFSVNNLESCLGATVNFTDQSTAPNSTVQSWSWDFGDNTTSTLQNPTKQYTTPGSYTVKLTTVSAAGCVSNVGVKTITVLPLPTASFTTSGLLCTQQSIQLNSTSTPGAGTITQYTWLLNGSPLGGNSASVSFTPTTTGPQNVSLSVLTDKGCVNTIQQAVTINPSPVVDFTLPVFCLPSGTAQFKNLSTISDGTQSQFTYAWQFGDGNTSTQAEPVHTYAAVGPYNVVLTVTSGNGCVGTKQQQLNSVYNPVVASFNAPAEVCLGSATSFTDASSAPGSTVTQWQWNFGDGNTSTQQNPTHTYAAAGTYTVTLSAKSTVGCESPTPFTKTIVVLPPPQASFNIPGPRCVGEDITFADASVANGGSIVKWSWDMGDGNAYVKTSNAPFTHRYTGAGPYTVTLKVETDKGCASTVFTRQVTINVLPVPAFTMPESCLSDPFSQFTDNSTISDGTQSQFTYLWNFGDPNATPGNPNTSTAQNPQHKYTAARNYNVTLTVTSNNGCAASLTQVFGLNGAVPQSVFSVQGGTDICSGTNVTITNNSTVDVGNIVKLEIYWDYANDPTNKQVDDNPAPGITYTKLYPEFFTPASRTYTIRVVAYSGENCLHTSTQTITVKARPQLQFDAVPSVCADVAPFQLNQARLLNGLPGSGQYSGPGVTATGMFDPEAAGNGQHTLRYTFIGDNGCEKFIERVVEVYEVPKADAGPDRVVLEGGSVTLVGSGTGPGLTYLWTPATALNNPAIAQPSASPVADMNYMLRVTTSDGCTSTDQVSVKLLKTPTIPNVFTPNGDGINDKWSIQYLETYPGCTVQVYNRYGQLIFESRGYVRPWDGTRNGKELPAGTYYYIIDPKNGRQQMTGFVDIVR